MKVHRKRKEKESEKKVSFKVAVTYACQFIITKAKQRKIANKRNKQTYL